MKVMFVAVHSLHLRNSYTISPYSSISLSLIIRKSRNHLQNIHCCLSTTSIVYLEVVVILHSYELYNSRINYFFQNIVTTHINFFLPCRAKIIKTPYRG